MFAHSVCDHSCRHLSVYLFTTLGGIQAEGLAGGRWRSWGEEGAEKGREGEGRGRRRQMEGRKRAQGKTGINQEAEGVLGI